MPLASCEALRADRPEPLPVRLAADSWPPMMASSLMLMEPVSWVPGLLACRLRQSPKSQLAVPLGPAGPCGPMLPEGPWLPLTPRGRQALRYRPGQRDAQHGAGRDRDRRSPAGEGRPAAGVQRLRVLIMRRLLRWVWSPVRRLRPTRPNRTVETMVDKAIHKIMEEDAAPLAREVEIVESTAVRSADFNDLLLRTVNGLFWLDDYRKALECTDYPALNELLSDVQRQAVQQVGSLMSKTASEMSEVHALNIEYRNLEGGAP